MNIFFVTDLMVTFNQQVFAKKELLGEED